jgi:hypothetical protein
MIWRIVTGLIIGAIAALILAAALGTLFPGGA